jgi:Subtilase family
MPFATGLAAVITVLGVVGSASALGAAGTAGAGVRADEWWLTGLGVTQAWQTSEGAGITVAVLGTGVAAADPVLAGAVITGPDYSDSGRAPGSPYWGVEGTAVAAIIAGRGVDGNWKTGIVGVAPDAKILSIRVTLEFNDPLAADQAISERLPGAIADGIRYAVDHGARVIDLPLDPGTLGMTSAGDPAAAGGSSAERAAVRYALSKNVVLVAPAGDDGQGSQIVNYPAAYPGVIAVGAVDRAGHLAAFSSRHSYPLLTAPGVGLMAAAPPDSYNQMSSTSTAGGIVAGVAALILARYPDLTVAQVTRALLESTATGTSGTGLPLLPARSDAGSGYGTVDAARALNMAALITAASLPPQPAAPAAQPTKQARPTAVAARQPGTSATAGTVLRAAVAGVGVLIVLLGVALLVGRSRRTRGAAGRARGHGQHEHRRPDHAAPDVTAAASPATPAAASPVTMAPGHGAGPGRPPPATPPAPAASRTATAASNWLSPGGWQGGGIGEIGDGISDGSDAPSRPVMAPAPRAAPGSRTRGAAAGSGPAGPPWDPAPEPDRMIGLIPVVSASSPLPKPGPRIRVPGDMAAPQDAAANAPVLPDFDLSTPPADFDVSAPVFGLAPPAFGAPRGPDLPAPPAADLPEPAGRDLPAPPGADAPAPTGPDLPTRQSLDFAAAPVPADYAAPPSARAGPHGHPAAVPPADPSYIWDLAATDVFPAAPGPGPATGTPDASSAPEESPGADES